MTPFRTSAPRRHRAGVWRVLRNVVVGLVVLLVLGAGVELGAEAVDRYRFPPAGQVVDLGDAQIYLLCQGTGSPTVVLESGQGEGLVHWSWVQPAAAKVSRVCAYDRPGYGHSRGPVADKPEQVAARLHALLAKAGEQGPYVLVGHSTGGEYSRVYAARYPDEVAGLVLVDARSERWHESLPPEFQASDSTPDTFSRIMPWLIRSGAGRVALWLHKLPDQNLIEQLPADLQGAFRAAVPAHNFAAGVQEARMILELDAAVKALGAATLGNRPLVVIQHDPKSQMLPPAGEEIWASLQKKFLDLSSRSSYVVAEGSPHTVQMHRPDVVVDAIRTVVETVRPGGR